MPLKRVKKTVLKLNKGAVLIEYDAILFCKTEGNCTRINEVEERTHIVSESLRKIEDRLQSEQFIKIHRSHIINIQHIREIDNKVIVMDDGTKLEIARRKKTPLKKLILKLAYMEN